jgi:hypothetical protein
MALLLLPSAVASIVAPESLFMAFQSRWCCYEVVHDMMLTAVHLMEVAFD